MRMLINAASTKMGGAVTYLENLVRALQQHGGAHHYLVCVPTEVLPQFEPWVDRSVVTLLPYPFDRTSGLHRVYFEESVLPRWIGEQGVDVLFSSTGFASFRARLPQSLLLPNMIYFASPHPPGQREPPRAALSRQLRRLHIARSVRAVDAVIFPSESMRAAVAAQFPMQHAETEVLHYGTVAEWPGEGEVTDLVSRMRGWQQDGFVLLLNVSSYAVHKNLETLVEALALLGGRKVKLIATLSREATGAKLQYDRLMERVDELGLAETLVCTGQLSRQGVQQLYRAADLFVFPSHLESFGLPMIEALAAGLPIVAADTPINQEVCGEAAVYFHTFDPRDCAQGLRALIDSASQRDRLGAAGANRARTFSWATHAARFVELHERVLDRYARSRHSPPRVVS